MNDPFAAWVPIMTRIRDRGLFRAVEPLPRLLALEDLSLFPSPACFVGYGGDDPGQNAGFGTVVQSWDVWIVDRNSRDSRSALDSCIAAGPLLADTVFVLTDYSPADSHSPLTRIAATEPVQYIPGGVVIFPLRFQTTFSI